MSTKPKVVQILSDPGVGGVRSSVESLIASELKADFDFSVQSMAQADLGAMAGGIVVVNDACSWKALPRLAMLKKAAKRAGVRVWIVEHHYCQGFEKRVSALGRFRAMLKLAYSLADGVLAVSEAQGGWMLRHKLVPAKRLKIIQQCRVLDDFLALPMRSQAGPLVIAAYGRFCLQKGFDVLIDAMRLPQARGVRLHLAGLGPEEGSLVDRARNLPDVQFFGPLKDIPAFLQSADAVVVPSRWEPWGNVCLEAKAAGRAVIASDVDGLSEQVRGFGLLTPPEDPAALADAIALLNQKEMQAGARAARASVAGAWERHLEHWRALLAETIG